MAPAHRIGSSVTDVLMVDRMLALVEPRYDRLLTGRAASRGALRLRDDVLGARPGNAVVEAAWRELVLQARAEFWNAGLDANAELTTVTSLGLLVATAGGETILRVVSATELAYGDPREIAAGFYHTVQRARARHAAGGAA